MLLVTGPKSRDLLLKLANKDLSNDAFPWLTAQDIKLNEVPCRALRVSYAGELGWELHHDINHMEKLYDTIMNAGHSFGAKDFGTYALNSLRLEKAYKGWGTELTTEITMIEANIERFACLDQGDFIGRSALLKRKREGVQTQCVYLGIHSNEVDCQGGEPVLVDGRAIGVTTSGAYGHCCQKSLAFAYVECAYAKPHTIFDVEILGEAYQAEVLTEAAYDPKNSNLKI